eukprot:g11082.t1
MAKNPSVLPVALAGFGTVGCGVMELILKNNEKYKATYGFELQVVKILVRSPQKHIDAICADPYLSQNLRRTSEAELKALFTTDIDAFLQTPAAIFVELIGGCTDAKRIVYEAARTKQVPVVTANKALLYENLQELLGSSGHGPDNTGAFFGYEAAVCGGIPIINALQTDFVADDVLAVSGIMNGTTNFILSKMELEGAAYKDVLKEAQELGYAEADPTADVEGYDARDKIGIIAKLAFGATLTNIPCKGISQLEKTDFDAAKTLLKSTIKLLTSCKKVDEDGDSGNKKISCFVFPHLVPDTHPIASCRGPTNLCTVTSRNLGDSVLVGPGAGRYPTANSVMNDLVKAGAACVQKGSDLRVSRKPRQNTTPLTFEADFPARGFYMRVKSGDVEQCAEAAGKMSLKLAKMAKWNASDIVLVTEPCVYSRALALAKAVASETGGVPPVYPLYG